MTSLFIATGKAYDVITASSSIRDAKIDKLKSKFDNSIEDIEAAISSGVDPTKVDAKFEKFNVVFGDYMKAIFENFDEASDQDQSHAFKESARIGDQVTKLKMKIYKYKRQGWIIKL